MSSNQNVVRLVVYNMSRLTMLTQVQFENLHSNENIYVNNLLLIAVAYIR